MSPFNDMLLEPLLSWMMAIPDRFGTFFSLVTEWSLLQARIFVHWRSTMFTMSFEGVNLPTLAKASW